ncbi:MAG: hypothetical protein RLZZ630_1897 [Bacteroidota bacterium]|jgi:hypothetical protein
MSVETVYSFSRNTLFLLVIHCYSQLFFTYSHSKLLIFISTLSEFTLVDNRYYSKLQAV